MPSILLIDDDDLLREYLAKELTARGYAVESLHSSMAGLDRLVESRFDVVVLDYWMSPLNGHEFMREIRARGNEVPVILMTGSPTAVVAMKAGSHRGVKYVVKPLDRAALVGDLDAKIGQILDRVREAARLPSVRFPSRANPEPDESGFIGNSQPMLDVLNQIGKYAGDSYPVLILGETGTGKELVARAIHAESPRKTRSFVAVNCGAIPTALADSQFFGHKKGIFTGADRDHIGFFERADGGTLFLDEIGDMPHDLQVKLLRAIQEGRFERLGGPEIKVDVRVLAATHRDLRKRDEEEPFREDLYNRLNKFFICVPPLRDRLEDLPELVDCILEREARNGGRRPEVAEATMDRLRAYQWPGNIRELEGVLARAFKKCQGSQILPSDLGLPADDGAKPASGTKEEAVASLRKAIAWALKSGGPKVWDDLHELLRQELVTAALEQCRNNKTAAAELLDVSPNTVRKYLKEDEQKE